jgi:hypothetical protein
LLYNKKELIIKRKKETIMGKILSENLVNESTVIVSEKRTIVIKVFDIQEKNKNKILEYKKIEMKNKGHKFSFYERLCYNTIFDDNGNAIGREIFTEGEVIEAFKRIIFELYKPLNLSLEDFIK